MQEWLLGIGLFVAVVWLAAILLALRDRTRRGERGPSPVFDPEHHLGLGIYARINPGAPLQRWKWALAVPLFLLVCPVYFVLLDLLLPLMLWQVGVRLWGHMRG